MSAKDHPLALFRFHLDFSPRFSDLGASGQVSSPRFFNYFEEARAAYLKRLSLLAEDTLPVSLLVARDTCRYRVPIQHHHLVQIHLRTADWGRRAFSFHYALWLPEEDLLAAQGHTRVQCLNPITQRACDLPEEFLRVMRLFEQGKLD